jgi:hypothetical protein
MSGYLLTQLPLKSSITLDKENCHDKSDSSKLLISSQENEIYNSTVNSNSVMKRSFGASPDPIRELSHDIVLPTESSVEISNIPSNPLSSLSNISNTPIPTTTSFSSLDPLASSSSSSSYSYFSYLPSIPPTPLYVSPPLPNLHFSPQLSCITSKSLNPLPSYSISSGIGGSVISVSYSSDEKPEKNNQDAKVLTSIITKKKYPKPESSDAKKPIRKDSSLNDSMKTHCVSQSSEKVIHHSCTPFSNCMDLSFPSTICSDSQTKVCNYHHRYNSGVDQVFFDTSCSQNSNGEKLIGNGNGVNSFGNDYNSGDLFENGSLNKKKDTYGEADVNSYQLNYESCKNQNTTLLQSDVSLSPSIAVPSTKVFLNIGELEPPKKLKINNDFSLSQTENYNKTNDVYTDDKGEANIEFQKPIVLTTISSKPQLLQYDSNSTDFNSIVKPPSSCISSCSPSYISSYTDRIHSSGVIFDYSQSTREKFPYIINSGNIYIIFFFFFFIVVFVEL